MATESPRTGVVDAVWLVARDEGWHRQSDFAKRAVFRDDDVAGALDFLDVREDSYVGYKRLGPLQTWT